MTIREAVERGVGRLRKPAWHSYAHIEIYFTRRGLALGNYGSVPAGEGELYHGPWMKLFDPPSKLALGRAPYEYDLIPSFGVDDQDFEEWTVPEDYGRFAPLVQDQAATQPAGV